MQLFTIVLFSHISSTSPRKGKVSLSQLSVSKTNEISIPPRENVAYSKETQTVNLEPIEKDGKCYVS